MGFQIRNKSGEPIKISELEEEAAAFWGVAIDAKKYAAPFKGGASWFDAIGIYIDAQRPRRSELKELRVEWCDVVGLMMGYNLLNESSEEVKASIDHFWCKYIELVRHWNALGYEPWAISE